MYKQKYAKYKNKYIALKHQHDNILYDYTNSEEVLKYIHSILPKKSNSNPNPYVLVLYGPPGSGKTLSKKFILDELHLDNNYVYFSEDEFAYHTKQFEELKNNSAHKQVDILQSEYNVIRKATSYIMYTLLGLALMYKLNAVIEMTGNGLNWYMTHLINEFHHHKYKIHLVYPYVNDVNILIERSIKRGNKEFRYVPEKYIRDVFVRSKDNFIKLINSEDVVKFNNIYVYDAVKIKLDGSNFKQCIIYQYDSGKILVPFNNVSW